MVVAGQSPSTLKYSNKTSSEYHVFSIAIDEVTLAATSNPPSSLLGALAKMLNATAFDSKLFDGKQNGGLQFSVVGEGCVLVVYAHK
jgi:hypothetical protein